MPSREDWIRATAFAEPRGVALLDALERRVGELLDRRQEPWVLFDLDGTLFDTRARTLHIVAEWMAARADVPEETARKIRGVRAEQRFFGIKDAFAFAGLDLTAKSTSDLLASLRSFWMERFFSSDYLHLDGTFSGTVGLVPRLHALGASIGYLTGRDFPRMGRGTRESLARVGFPVEDPRVRLLLKEDPKTDDAEHRRQVVGSFAGRAEVVACFDNEPSQILALQGAVPGAMHVFVDTMASEADAPAGSGLYYLAGFDDTVDVTSAR